MIGFPTTPNSTYLKTSAPDVTTIVLFHSLQNFLTDTHFEKLLTEVMSLISSKPRCKERSVFLSICVFILSLILLKQDFSTSHTRNRTTQLLVKSSSHYISKTRPIFCVAYRTFLAFHTPRFPDRFLNRRDISACI